MTDKAICPRCGAEISTESNFCSKCGAKLPTENNLCSQCGAEISAESNFCSKCGLQQSDNEIQLGDSTSEKVIEKNNSGTGKGTRTQLNILIGALLVSLILIWTIGASGTHTNTHPNLVTSSAPESSPVQQGIYQYIDFTLAKYHSIGYNYAPTGYSYEVATVHIKNTGSHTYSTNAFYWQLEGDGITYSTDTSTFDSNVNYHLVKVGPGGEITTQFSFLVPSDVHNFNLIYNGPD